MNHQPAIPPALGRASDAALILLNQFITSMGGWQKLNETPATQVPLVVALLQAGSRALVADAINAHTLALAGSSKDAAEALSMHAKGCSDAARIVGDALAALGDRLGPSLENLCDSVGLALDD